MKKRLLSLVTAMLVSSFALVGCGTSNSNNENGTNGSGKDISIKISGSTSIAPLMEKEAESYKGKNEGVNIEIQAVGSSSGIQNALNGITEIGMASRDLKSEEKNVGLKEEIIAYDGIAIITNKNNKVKELTSAQIKDIYTGKIKNWKDVGGEDKPIVVVSREDGSGTRDAFQEILGYKSEELVQDATIADGSGNIKTTVQNNDNAIGYVSFEQLDDLITVQKVDGAEATPEKVKAKEYKLSRPFLLVYNEEKISEKGKNFIDFILSEDGQNIVQENGSIKID